MNKLYIFCGIPFSGKTTIAQKVANELDFVRIDLDEIKFEIYGENITDGEIDQKGWDKIYNKMYKRIERRLKKGDTVIHDTGNFTEHERGLVKNIAEKFEIETFVVYINTTPRIAKKRLLENKKTKQRFDVKLDDFYSTVEEMEPPSGSKVIKYNYPENIDDWITKYFK